MYLNKDKKSCKDVFHAFMLQNATYSGYIELPNTNVAVDIPNKLVAFSKIYQSDDYDCWVHFYEHDYIIERIWHNPEKYLPQLKKFNGVILPDFSLYRDMPLVLQYYNIYRSRVIGCWLSDNQISIIPNIRFGDNRTVNIACLGISTGSVISVGTHGSIKNKADRTILESGIQDIISIIHPSTLIVYGCVTNAIVNTCNSSGTNLVIFKSDFALSHSKESEVK